jgi:LPXTG-motif cell wall-anchored protein
MPTAQCAKARIDREREKHMNARSRAGIAAVAAALTVLTWIGAAPSAMAASPKLTISDTTVTAGQTLTVTGSSFPSKKTSLYIAICQDPPGATNCDQNLSRVVQVDYDGSGSFTTKYKVAVTKFDSASGTIDCAKTQCVVGSTNAYDPKDHSYNATAKFTVASSGGSSSSPKPTATASDTTQSPSSTKTTSSEGTGALPKTGGDQNVPLIAGGAVAAILAGLVIIVLTTRRRSQH